jgi:hypothetical protein
VAVTVADAPGAVPGRDVARALGLLRRAEARAPVPRARGPQPYQLEGRRLLRLDADGVAAGPTGPRPASGERLLGASGDVRRVVARSVAADEVRLAKLAGGSRVRAFYGEAGLTCAVHRADRVTARLLVGARAQRALGATGAVRVPRLVATGRSLGVAWVVEETVVGQHPAPAEQDAVAQRLAPALLDAGLRLGARRRRVGAVLGRRGLAEVASLLTDHGAEVGSHVHGQVVRLLDDPRAVVLAVCHGDPVLGNVLRRGPAGDLVLIDWELARVLPVGTDVAKLATGASDLPALLAACRDALPGARTDLPLADQVAVALLRGLGGWRASRATARVAGRGEAWERRTAARLRLLSSVLAVGGPG